MAEKDDHFPLYPLPLIIPNFDQESPSSSSGGRDEHESDHHHQHHRNKKHIQYLAYFTAFLVSQTGIVFLFSLTILKVRTPKFSINSANFEFFQVLGITTTNPSFNFRINAEIILKNNNFGDYKFGNSTIYFFHNNYQVGEVFVPELEAGIRSTMNFNVSVNLSSDRKDSKLLEKYAGPGRVIKLKSRSKLSGKVDLGSVLKKEKVTHMDCILTVGVYEQAIRQITCK